MREIEFRAWLKHQNRMVNVQDLIMNGTGVIGFQESCENPITDGGHHFIMFELMQYTGLKDKNGVKIFEGDIVKIWGRGFTNKLGCDNAIVVFEEAQFAFYINERYYKIWKDSCGMYEVIDNIYENKELLENV